MVLACLLVACQIQQTLVDHRQHITVVDGVLRRRSDRVTVLPLVLVLMINISIRSERLHLSNTTANNLAQWTRQIMPMAIVGPVMQTTSNGHYRTVRTLLLHEVLHERKVLLAALNCHHKDCPGLTRHTDRDIQSVS